MEYKHILFDVKDGIATLTLNRPEVYNAFNEAMSFEVIDALKKCRKDDAIRVVVITGAGKAFCSGQDLKDIQDKSDRSLGDSVKRRYNPMIQLICETPKPFIARLNGVAAGAGASLALACDYVVASEKASLIEVFINVGLVLDSGSSYFLPRLVGLKRAFEFATQATRISAERALELGMVNKVVPADQLDDATAETARYYAQAPTKAVGMIKKLLHLSFQNDLRKMLEMEYYYQEIAGRSEDYREGVQAFVEKRKPRFQGK